jgi:DNA-directed RNA polymerase subunit RPC12/RpoP
MPSGRKVELPTVTYASHAARNGKIRCMHCKSEYAVLVNIKGKPMYRCPRCKRLYSTPLKRSS